MVVGLCKAVTKESSEDRIAEARAAAVGALAHIVECVPVGAEEGQSHLTKELLDQVIDCVFLGVRTE